MSGLFIGLMSGTSLDGVDAVLADLSDSTHPLWLGHAHLPFDADLRQRLLDLHTPGAHELHRAQLAAFDLTHLYATLVAQLLATQHRSADQVCAMGSHGQTIRHQPPDSAGKPSCAYTIQLQQPALLAELTGIRVVADFRSRDIAAGGQGAPLVPAFHQALWANPTHGVAVLNLGGIANLSLLQPGRPLAGFDCGPGNILMDAWHQRHLGGRYDDGGSWAASGQCQPRLLETLLAEPFFQAPAPKSTGRDLFHLGWLDAHLAGLPPMRPVDVQATLLELSAQSCAQALLHHMPAPSKLVVCGGGTDNIALMQRLGQLLAPCPVLSSAVLGLAPMHVEAAAFAWLAQRTILGLAGNVPSVTGARGPRVLGAIYPA